MREVTGDLWSYVKIGAVIVIPTNGERRVDGWRNIMGKGVAKQALVRYPTIDQRIGKLLRQHGNRCFKLTMGTAEHPWTLVTFPTKDRWREPSDLAIIEDSATQLVEMADKFEWTEIILPRVGTGVDTGKLDWADVQRVIAPIFDSRFVVVELEQTSD